MDSKRSPEGRSSCLFTQFGPDHQCVSAPSTVGMRLEFKRIDKTEDWAGGWTISKTKESAIKNKADRYAEYAEYSFLVRRKLSPQDCSVTNSIFTTKILIQSHVLQTAIRCVLKDVQKLSWNVWPFKVMSSTIYLLTTAANILYRWTHSYSLPITLDSQNT
jgi:hypothetical protein